MNIFLEISVLQAIPQSKKLKAVVTGAHREIYLTHFVALFQMTKKTLVLFNSNTSFSASCLFLSMTLLFFANLVKAKTLDAHLHKARIFKTLEGKENELTLTN